MQAAVTNPEFPPFANKSCSEGIKVIFLQDAVDGIESRAASHNTYNY